MKIKVKNLGTLKQAELELGNLTIICGGNNTGKTYATYALFGFLSVWKQIIEIEIKQQQINQLFQEGVISIDLEKYLNNAENILNKGGKKYTGFLPKIFASSPDNFKNTEFFININISDNKLNQNHEEIIGSTDKKIFSLIKSENSKELIVTLLTEKENRKFPDNVIREILGSAIKNILFKQFFPNCFIASAERTGSAIFRKELNFSRNRLLEEISQTDKNIDPIELLFKGYDDYALPIKENVAFLRNLETIAKKRSFIAEENPDLLDSFVDIIGGEYTVTKNDELYYIPTGKKIKLSMDESSSAVRSLLDIGFYIKHIAKKGDLLIVDEPELNLHPENQRRIARLFARLINLGVKVFITTHSDYIIKELNTLIMLNQNKPYLKEIAQREGYQKNELLSIKKIKVYIAEEALIQLDNRQKRSRCQTLTPANITEDLGIEISSFDTAIETMNRIQEEIIWGEE